MSILAEKVTAKSEGLLYIAQSEHYFIKWADCSPLLKDASPEERMSFELSPSGYGIHWYLLDEDLSIAGLMSKAEKLE